MTNKAMGFARGMALGMAAGTVLGAVVKPRSRKRRISRAARAAGLVIENVAQSIWG
ncbi:MAG: hypothetical protein IJ072_07320 [Oscillospiraceae bacterium]|nr:hypothetical protein [Oscillospiraceae bacterium]